MAIDISKLSSPVKAVLIDGGLVEAGEQTWTGVWAFPPGWSDVQQQTWTEIQGRILGEQKRLDAITLQIKADLESPEAQLTAARAEADDAQRAREGQERLSAGTRAWAKALETYGANCRHLLTVDGDVVIMVGMTLPEVDAANARASNLAAKVLEEDPNARLRAEVEHLNAQRDAMLAKIIWPDRERFKAIATSHPELWQEVRGMRNEMARARADTEGKGSAL
jgi:hypothetical protein